MNTYVYELHDNLYINITNECTNDCVFCLRNTKDGVGGANLWLDNEPSVQDIMEQLKAKDPSQFREIVFCGFGESTMRLDIMLNCCKEIHQLYDNPIRLNTNGQANLHYGRDITPEFEGLINIVSISLNETNGKDYEEICHSRYGEQAFDAILDFASRCKKHVADVRFSIVDILPEEKKDQCLHIADKIGVILHVRHFIPN